MRWPCPFLVLAWGGFQAVASAAEPAVGFRLDGEQLVVTVGEHRIADYVLSDANTPRPYFARLRTLSGVPVTRNHPPREGDLQDHAAMHPGLWLAFGDLNGNDFWRLKAKVVHERFSEPPRGGPKRGGFVAENLYLDEAGQRTIARETRRVAIHLLPPGWLLVWDSTFSSDSGELVFGDQEEMGLGVRLATPLAVASGKGGRMVDREGRVNEREVWGTAGAWCDCYGPIGDKFVGVTLFAHPANFRPSWRHARDYGLLVANPFGNRALTGGPVSQVVVKQGETLRLRFGVFVHETDAEDDRQPEEAYQAFTRLIKD